MQGVVGSGQRRLLRARDEVEEPAGGDALLVVGERFDPLALAQRLLDVALGGVARAEEHGHPDRPSPLRVLGDLGADGLVDPRDVVGHRLRLLLLRLLRLLRVHARRVAHICGHRQAGRNRTPGSICQGPCPPMTATTAAHPGPDGPAHHPKASTAAPPLGFPVDQLKPPARAHPHRPNFRAVRSGTTTTCVYPVGPGSRFAPTVPAYYSVPLQAFPPHSSPLRYQSSGAGRAFLLCCRINVA